MAFPIDEMMIITQQLWLHMVTMSTLTCICSQQALNGIINQYGAVSSNLVLYLDNLFQYHTVRKQTVLYYKSPIMLQYLPNIIHGTASYHICIIVDYFGSGWCYSTGPINKNCFIYCNNIFIILACIIIVCHHIQPQKHQI